VSGKWSHLPRSPGTAVCLKKMNQIGREALWADSSAPLSGEVIRGLSGSICPFGVITLPFIGTPSLNLTMQNISYGIYFIKSHRFLFDSAEFYFCQRRWVVCQLVKLWSSHRRIILLDIL
jgi:hypothetical protein